VYDVTAYTPLAMKHEDSLVKVNFLLPPSSASTLDFHVDGDQANPLWLTIQASLIGPISD
jgi:hypothetical protein